MHGRGHDGAKLLEVHGLAQVVEGAGAQGFDHVVGRAVGGDDHAALGALLRAQVMQQFQPQPIGQAHVGEHGIEALGLQLRARLLHAVRGFDTVALAQQGQLVERAQVGFVIDDQDGGSNVRHGRWKHQTTMVSKL
ncbi:hypothetical protein D3C78_1450820 [compost metagenome]